MLAIILKKITCQRSYGTRPKIFSEILNIKQLPSFLEGRHMGCVGIRPWNKTHTWGGLPQTLKSRSSDKKDWQQDMLNEPLDPKKKLWFELNNYTTLSEN